MKIRFVLLLLMVIFSSTNTHSQNEYNSWGYQLQDFTVQELSDSPYDLLVIDYSFDGSDEQALTSDQVNAIQSSSKTVVSYISIGEAEDYRYYFDEDWISNSPDWFDGENPDWQGNYKVKFWDAEWQSIIYDYLDKIISAKFNGVYLDIIDAYEFYLDEVSDADQRMMDFVTEISEYGKANSGFGDEFMVIPQNGEGLLANTAYRSSVDAIGREDVYIIQDEQNQRDSDEILEIESDLDLLIEDGKPVFVVDYTKNQELIKFARESASQKGYIHYIGTLDLNELVASDYSGTTAESPTHLMLIPLIFIILIRKNGVNLAKQKKSITFKS